MILNNTMYRKELLEDYLKINNKNTINLCLMFFIFLVSSIFLGIFVHTFSFILTGFISIFILLFFIGTISLRKNLYRSFCLMEGCNVSYEFLDNEVNISINGKNIESKISYEYKSFVQLIEGPVAMYLFISGNQFYIIDKQELSEEELLFIKKKLYSSLNIYNMEKINHKKPMEYYYNKPSKKNENFYSLLCFYFSLISFFVVFITSLGDNLAFTLCLIPIILASIIFLSIMFCKNKEKINIIFIVVLCLIFFLTIVMSLSMIFEYFFTLSSLVLSLK